MLSPTTYLDLCCEKFTRKKDGDHSIDSEFGVIGVENDTIQEFIQESISCCLLSPIDYEVDYLTNNLVPIYTYKENPLSKLIDEESRQKLNSLKLDIELNYSALDFPNDIWNTRETWEISVKTIAVIPLVIIAILGNLAVISVVMKRKILRKNPVNLFILNMSIADLACALFFPWIFLVSDFYQTFVLGSFICKSEGFVLISLMLASMFTLTVISFDRLIAIVFPFNLRLKPKRAKFVIFCIWIIACAVSTPLTIWRTYKERQWKNFHETWCTEDIKRLKDYWLLLVVLLVWVPLFALTISYTAIFIKLYTLENRHRDQPICQIKHKTRVIRMLFLVVLAFGVCWIPFTSLIFLRNYRTTNSAQLGVTEWYRTLFFVSHYLTFLNSAINPIIYGLMNDNLKRELRHYIFPFCLKNKNKIQVSTVLPNGQIGIVDQTKNDKTKLQKVAEKYGLLLSTSSTIPSLSSFDRKNSALLDLGLPVPDFTSSTDSLKLNYEVFSKSD